MKSKDYYRSEKDWSDTLRSSNQSGKCSPLKTCSKHDSHLTERNRSINALKTPRSSNSRLVSPDLLSSRDIYQHKVISPRLNLPFDVTSSSRFSVKNDEIYGRISRKETIQRDSRDESTQFLAEKLKEYEKNFANLRSQYQEIIDRQSIEIEQVKREKVALENEMVIYEQLCKEDKVK